MFLLFYNIKKGTEIHRTNDLTTNGCNETDFDINSECVQNNKARKYSMNSTKPQFPQPTNSLENKLSLTQHNKLYTERKNQHSNSINLSPPGSSAHSSRSGTSNEFYERSPAYMKANEVHIFCYEIIQL